MILSKQKIESIDLDFMLAQAIKEGNHSAYMIVVPTNRRLRSLKKYFIDLSPLNASVKLNIETFTTLSEKLLAARRNFHLLSEAAATVLIKQSVSKCSLAYFDNYKGNIPFGTLDRITNVISEYKRSGITPRRLKEEAVKLDGAEKFKALDIATIYEEYLARCIKLNSYEIGDIYTELLNLKPGELAKYFKEISGGISILVFDGFDEFSDPEIQIINLLSAIDGINLFLSFDYYTFNPLLFSHLDQCYEKLKQSGFEPVKDLSRDSLDKFKTLIRERLFRRKRDTRIKDYSDRITRITASSKENEVELIASSIKLLIINARAEPSSICVVFNKIDKYSSAVKKIFGSYGIPFNLTDRIPLSNSPVISAIINLLEIIENDFYYKNIFRAFSSKYLLPLGIDVNNLMNVSVHLKIISGKENWLAILESAVVNIDDEKSGNGDYENDIQKEPILKAIGNINRISSMLADFEKKNTVNDFLTALENLIIKQLNLPQQVINSRAGDAEENVRALTAFTDTVKEIFSLLAEEKGPDEKFSLKFFMDQIRTACGWARFNIKEKPGYGVLVTSINEIRGLKFGYLFIGGLVDGDFPSRFFPEIFLSGSFAKSEMIHQTAQRYLFYQALCTWQKELYLSAPSAEANNELSESSFIKEFERIVNVRGFNNSNISGKILSEEGFLIFAGSMGRDKIKNIYKNFEKDIGPDYERLFNAVDIDKSRLDSRNSDSVYEGSIFSAADYPVNEIGKERINKLLQSEFSISQLETYAGCPFKFFIEKLLRVKGLDEPAEDIEPLELGALLHEILFKFYVKLRERGITLNNCTHAQSKEAEKILFTIAESEFERSPFRSPLSFFEKEKIFGINGNKRQSLLYKFLEVEQTNSEAVPSFFEVAFGSIRQYENDKSLYSSEPLKAGEVKLRGKIDRIEIDEDGQTFNVVDYKLGGKKPAVADLENGLSLQLPIYLLAARNLLKKIGKNVSPLEMVIYSLKYQSEKFGRDKINLTRKKNLSKEDLIDLNENIIDTAIGFIKKYVESIAGGKFKLSGLPDREKKVCSYCDYKSVCRVKEKIS